MARLIRSFGRAAAGGTAAVMYRVSAFVGLVWPGGVQIRWPGGIDIDWPGV